MEHMERNLLNNKTKLLHEGVPLKEKLIRIKIISLMEAIKNIVLNKI
jgi:hypothetical protein